MTDKTCTGSCLCGEITYEIQSPFRIFQYCHCSRCRKFTGSGHATNLFVPPGQFRWVSGEDKLGRFEHPEAKYFSTTFCKRCGSSMPWAVQGGKNIVVTAGTLDDDPGIRPMWHLFWSSRAEWCEQADDLPRFDQYPSK